MKLTLKQILYFLSIIIFLVSCENIIETSYSIYFPEGITFKGAITSRATDTAFEVDDEISVTAYNSDGSIYAQNIYYTYTGELFSSETPIAYSSDEQELSFRAAYPYVIIPESKIINFAVFNFQNVYHGYSLSDLMLSYVSPTTSNSPELYFDHLMTKFIINITSSDVEMVNVVATLNAITVVEYNLSTLSSTPTGNIETITMASNGVNSYKAIVVPQEVEANSIFGTITVDGISYELSFSQDTELIGGKEYTIGATIFDDKIVFDTPIINDWEDGEFPEVIDERSALVALYNATGGDNWSNNTNWCSDEPISQWYGVTVNEEGQVTELFLKYNGLSGEIGDLLQPLTALESLELSTERCYRLIDGTSNIEDYIDQSSGENNSLYGDIDLSKNVNLRSVVLDGTSAGYNNFDSITGVEKLTKLELLSMYNTGISSIDISQCTNLKYLNALCTRVKTYDLSKLTNLEHLNINNVYNSTDNTVIFGANSKFKSFHISYLYTIQNFDLIDFEDLEYFSIISIKHTDLYADISRCSKLVNIASFSNSSTISLNIDISQNYDLVKFYVLNCNILNTHLVFPSSTTTMLYADNCGLESIDITNLTNLSTLSVTDNHLTSLVLPSSNDLYLVYCGNNEIEGDFSEVFAQMLRSNYTKNFFYLKCSNNNITGNLPASLADRDLYNFTCCYNKMSGTIPEEIVKNSAFNEIAENAHLYGDPDNNNYHDDVYSGCCINPQKDGYGLIVPDLNYYDSEDYSQDGVVLTLQTASEGNGIDIVFVGDGFVDTQMGTDGEYETRMKQAMEAFFDEEPIKSFRSRYNVYAVKAVSQNEGVGDGQKTVFSSVFTDGSTLITGDDTKIFEYALKVPDILNTDNLTTICIINSYNYAGTCYMYYANNATVSYCPIVYNDDTSFKNIILHEAAGHGFGKLADEYYYTGTTITTSAISAYETEYSLGWMNNVDITNDPAQINWAHMISDPVYSNYVDIIEGAYTYQYGAYRPTQYSIMYYNTGGFNAPSRDIIYKWIMELSGDTYSFEKFKEYDQINITQTATATRAAQIEEVDKSMFKPTSPPVVINGKPNAQKK